MTSEQKTPDEIHHLARNEGPVVAAVALCLADYEDEALILALAAGASHRNALLSSQDEAILSGLSGSRFFDVQIILDEVIPHLTVSPPEVMGLVRRLVEKGGEDMAANQPNAAFRKWCAADLTRADVVIAAARGGDENALHHLVFALEAKGDPDEAFRSAQTAGPQRTAGILALSRLSLDADQAQRAVALMLEMAKDTAPAEAVGPLHAALDIASKHDDLDRSGLADALSRLATLPDPSAVHLLATALYWHLQKMTAPEYEACLLGVLSVDPENAGTVDKIDSALRELWKTQPKDAARTTAGIISRTEGRVADGELRGFFHAARTGDARALAGLATSWLLEADHQVCDTLTALFSEINRTEPCIEILPEDLPAEAVAQLYLCRRAIGFLFISPMTAATWIVAVLRGGHPDAARKAADLLFDPLLVNYGGALNDWLKRILVEDAPGQDELRDTLDRAQSLRDGIEAADIVELEPSTHRRAQVQFMEAEEAERVQEKARAQSIFADIITTQNLLYGDRSSFRMTGADGRRRSQMTHMAEMSVSSELPKSLVFDPIGLEHMLEVLRLETRPEA